MAVFIPGEALYFDNAPIFPLDGPPIADPDWELVEVKFIQPAWDNAFGEHDFVEFSWSTLELLGSSGYIGKIVNSVAEYFSSLGEGQPLAYRLYHREVFDVTFPTQVCVPDYIPFAGGCHDIPVVGGATVASGHQWHLQFIYHNPVEAFGVWGFLTALLVVGVIGAAVLAATHGKVDLGSVASKPVKEIIDASASAAKGVASSLGLVFLAGVGLIVALAIFVPQLGTQTTVHAGPVTTTLRGREPPSTRRSS